MSTPRITTIEKLHEYLHVAMQLEHATIPPYLLALYSIYPGANPAATQVLRTVVVEEMLHLTLAANMMNATGGQPNLNADNFVPVYPAYLPDGEDYFQVGLGPFSHDALKTFLNIERPSEIPPEKRLLKRTAPPPPRESTLVVVSSDDGLDHATIGEFYDEIISGFKYLAGQPGVNLFSGDPKKQATSEYYYSGGGELFAVTDLDSAVRAAELIKGQGEGSQKEIHNTENELAHYFRFQQLQLGRYYMLNDTIGNPTGPELTVDWNAVYPFAKNAKLDQYPKDSEVYAAAEEFNAQYAGFLAFLTRAYNGEPHLLLEAVPKMFRIRNLILQLIHNPFPGKENENAAPTFEIQPVAVTA